MSESSTPKTCKQKQKYVNYRKVRSVKRFLQNVTTGNSTTLQNVETGMDADTCHALHVFSPKLVGQTYCNSTFDQFLCWPPTLGNVVSYQRCPKLPFSDPKQFAFRTCGDDGRWLGRHRNDTNPNGWTNYTPCFHPLVQTLFFQVYNQDESIAQYKFDIARNTRIIEFVGFALSFITLTISLSILHKFKALDNLRTKIHKNLFLAMNAQVVLRLIVYIGQAVERLKEGTPSYTGISPIENLPYLCISMYVTLEYFITVMFIWMLNEGFYLNTLVTSNVLRANISYKYFCTIGWLLPVIITGVWATVASYDYVGNTTLRCWYGYNFQPTYWLLQGPRLGVIVINFCFLTNIMRVLVMKLRQDYSSDVVRIRKMTKAAMVLLPLLGITNILNMFEGPIGGSVLSFATWSYSTHILRSFQGAFIATLYCLMNDEVHAIVGRSANNRMEVLHHSYPRLARVLGFRRQSSRGRSGPTQYGGSGGRRTFEDNGAAEDGLGGSDETPGTSTELQSSEVSLKTFRFWKKTSQNQNDLPTSSQENESQKISRRRNLERPSLDLITTSRKRPTRYPATPRRVRIKYPPMDSIQ